MRRVKRELGIDSREYNMLKKTYEKMHYRFMTQDGQEGEVPELTYTLSDLYYGLDPNI